MRPTTTAQIALSFFFLSVVSNSRVCVYRVIAVVDSHWQYALRSSFCSLKWNSEAHELFLWLRAAAKTNRSLYIQFKLLLLHYCGWKEYYTKKKKQQQLCTHWFACSVFFPVFSIQVEINKWCFRVCVYCHLAAWQKTPWVGCAAPIT